MTAERWAQVKQLFAEAVEQPAGERDAFVCAHANGDDELREQALAMLKDGDQTGLLDLQALGRPWILPAVLARSLNPGEMLAGRYRILRPIGAGGMGEVYEAEDLDLGARIAVKVMRIEDEETLARFKREVQLARTVTHPNVCRIFDLHRHHEPESGRVVTFFTMELADGETLSEYLARRGALPPAEALPIVRQVAAALAAAHAKNVVHRDLKPSNVILADDGGRVVVTDFGVARPLTQAAAATVTIAGTPVYMAPEQLEGKPVTAAADIYAFGVLLYEMVTGRRPFAAESPIALALEKMRGHPRDAADYAPALPSVWNQTIGRCLEPKPENRPSRIGDVLRLLEDAVNRPPLVRLTRAQKRVSMATAAAVALAAFFTWRYTQSVYTPGGEALRLYRQGVHAEQIGLPWKASQFFERAVEEAPPFLAARVHLAESWMALDQPARARTELERGADLRPRWRRVAAYESLMEQAARARLAGNLTGAVQWLDRAVRAAPYAQAADVRFALAAAKTRAGDGAGALSEFGALAAASVSCRCAAMMAQVSRSTEAVLARRLFNASAFCFESAGDLDGAAQSWFEFARFHDDHSHEMAQRAASIARATGNIEQQILIAGLNSRLLLELGDDDGSYNSFATAMQLADQIGAPFLSALLLDDRAAYFFEHRDFVQSDNYDIPASTLARSTNMPWTFARCSIREASGCIRMRIVTQALRSLDNATDLLRQYPNAALSAEIERLRAEARQTPARPEDIILSNSRTPLQFPSSPQATAR
jgi:hypothetical protein